MNGGETTNESGYEANRINHGPADPAGLDIPPGLAAARQTVDNIDAALAHTLAGRFRYTQRVGHIKAPNGLPPTDPVCKARQVTHLWAPAGQSSLDPDFAQKFLAFTITEVVRHHEDIKAEYEDGE